MRRKCIAWILVLVLASMLTGCGLAVPRPEIKEGRFDLSVTYEISGEVKTFTAVYVCEFDGSSWTPDGFDFSRDWKGYVEGDHEGDYNSAIIGKTEDGGDIILFFGVYPEYFMGDYTGDSGVPTPSVYVVYPEDEHGCSTSYAEPTEVEELFGVKIISHEYAAPIENEFGLFK